MNGRLEWAGSDFIEERLGDAWGLPIISVSAIYETTDGLEGLIWRGAEGEAIGLVTWCVGGGSAEIVTLDAFVQGQGIGRRLMDGAEAELSRLGVRRVVITTTNDNVRAIAFYLRRGYRIVRVDLDGMDRVRAAKPGVPLTGHDGLPLRDMLELEKVLG